MVKEKELQEVQANGVYFVKMINSSDFMKTNDEMKSWGSADYREWHDSWPQWV